MLAMSLAAALAFAQAAQGSTTKFADNVRSVPTLESEAKRMGVSLLTLRRALRGTSHRRWVSRNNPLYCFIDRLSVPERPRRVCYTKTQWANAGFELILP